MIPLNLMEAIFDVPEEYLCKFTSMRQHRENQPSLKAHNLNNTDHALAILTIPKFKYSVPWYPHIYDNTALVLPFSSILVLRYHLLTQFSHHHQAVNYAQRLEAVIHDGIVLLLAF